MWLAKSGEVVSRSSGKNLVMLWVQTESGWCLVCWASAVILQERYMWIGSMWRLWMWGMECGGDVRRWKRLLERRLVIVCMLVVSGCDQLRCCCGGGFLIYPCIVSRLATVPASMWFGIGIPCAWSAAAS